MPYDTNRSVTDDVDDNLSQYFNEQGTAIAHVMSSAAYANYGTAVSSSGTVTLTDASLPIQSITPGTANVSVILPAAGTTNHALYVMNAGTAAYTIQVYTSGTVAVGSTISATGMSPYFSNGLAWFQGGGGGGFNPTVTSAAAGNLIFHDGSIWRNIGGLRDGLMVNGKISVTVTSNNITVALKTRSGGNPSATDPVLININGTYRVITAALSVTKNAGTNYFGSGGPDYATVERDYFAYLGYNATDGVVIGFSTIPFGRIYSDFNTTATNDHYCAISTITNAAAGDDYRNIGRFAATLSAAAGYNWSVPTFTSVNLIQNPWFETRWLTWNPTDAGGGLVGWSADPASSVYSYKIVGDVITVAIRQGAAATSDSTLVTISAPLTAKTVTNMGWSNTARVSDNGGTAAAALFQISSAGVLFEIFTNLAGTGWTASGQKRIYSGQITYQT